MSTDAEIQIAQLSAQVIALQELVMHQQRELELMHEALLAQKRDMETLGRRVIKTEDLLQRAVQGDNFPSPEEDRPPHY